MRTKKAIYNFLTDVFPQLMIALIGIFKIKLFLNILGEETLGLYQLYGQIIQYLTLIEGGVGTAALYKLYKPVANNDENKISEIMSASRKLFNIIAIIITIIGIIIAFNIGFFIKEYNFSNSYLFITFLIYVLSQSIYYFTVPERNIFEANQKRYIPNIVFQFATLIKSIVELIIILLGGNLIFIVTSLLITSILANTIMVIVTRKYYPKINYKSKKDFSMLKDVKHLIVNTLGNLVANNIDIIIISKVIGLSSVVIYSAYNMIIETLKNIVEKITGAVTAGIANILIKEKERAHELFNELNSFVLYIALILCTPLYFSINHFLNIFYNNDISTSPILSLLFTILLFYQILRIPLKVFTLADGKFKDIKVFTIVECIINLSLSLILVKFLKIPGVLLATIISYFMGDYIPKSIIVHKKILNASSYKYHLKNVSYILLSIVLVIGISKINYIPTNLLSWAIYSIIIALINGIIVTCIFYIFKDFSFIERLNIKKFFKRK